MPKCDFDFVYFSGVQKTIFDCNFWRSLIQNVKNEYKAALLILIYFQFVKHELWKNLGKRFIWQESSDDFDPHWSVTLPNNYQIIHILLNWVFNFFIQSLICIETLDTQRVLMCVVYVYVVYVFVHVYLCVCVRLFVCVFVRFFIFPKFWVQYFAFYPTRLYCLKVLNVKTTKLFW